jgi:hypothetical protein
MNNAQKKAAIEKGFRNYLDPTPEYYWYDNDYKDKLLLSAYLQGWNDAEDAHGHAQTNARERTIEMKLTTQQQEALQALVDYVLVNERNHFMEHVEEGNPPENHIYTQAVILNELREQDEP